MGLPSSVYINPPPRLAAARSALFAEVGRRAAEARALTGWSRPTVCDMVGISESTLVRIERGDGPTDLYTLGLLASSYGIPLISLLPMSLPQVVYP